MENAKKIGAGIAAAGTLVGGGVAVDRQIDPYLETPTHYEVRIAGERVAINKNRPEVRLERWGGEEALTVKKAGTYGQSKRSLFSKQRRWENGKEAVVVTPLTRDEFSIVPTASAQTITETQGEEGFKIDILLEEKPDTNAFSFELEGWEDLDFSYQPPLTEEAREGETCTETQCVDAERNITRERPENVVGSYAVYHKTKRDHIVGETNYQTGKLYHIYRPLVVDADGNEAWGELSYSEGVLSVTVPQEFLASAVYPVTVDPTFGYTSFGASTVGFGGNIIGTFETVAESGAVTQISAAARTQSAGTMNIDAALYAGSSKTYIQEVNGNASVNTTILNWYNLDFAVEPGIAASTEYIAVMRGEDGGAGLNTTYDSVPGGKASWNTPDAIDTSWTSPLTSSSFNGYKISIYATYTAGGGDPEPTPAADPGIIWFD